MTQDKSGLRRTKVFSALDAMKEAGEKITAQKLAAAVNMGKQTVLPLYREWQELEVLGDSEGVELSSELTRALKRELARDKFRQSSRLLELEEGMEDQHQAFTETISQLQQEIQTLADQGKTFEQRNLTLNQEKELLEKANSVQLSRVKELESQLSFSEKQLETVESKLQTSEDSKERALQEQEKRLDEAGQKLLNHWLSVVDSERREKERLNKQLEREKEKIVKVERELAETRQDVNRLDTMLDKTHEENAELNEQIRELKQKATVSETISLMLGKPEDLLASVKKLQENASELNKCAEKNHELERSLQIINKKLDAYEQLQKSNIELEKEVIKLQAYTDGLKEAAKTPTRNVAKQKA